MPPQLEKNHVVPTAWQDEALARDGVSREVPCSALKGETSAAEAAAQNALQNAPQAAAANNNESILTQQQTQQGTQPEQPQKLFKGRFEVEGTKEQIIALGNYMKANNIKFSTIK